MPSSRPRAHARACTRTRTHTHAHARTRTHTHHTRSTFTRTRACEDAHTRRAPAFSIAFVDHVVDCASATCTASAAVRRRREHVHACSARHWGPVARVWVVGVAFRRPPEPGFAFGGGGGLDCGQPFQGTRLRAAIPTTDAARLAPAAPSTEDDHVDLADLVGSLRHLPACNVPHVGAAVVAPLHGVLDDGGHDWVAGQASRSGHGADGRWQEPNRSRQDQRHGGGKPSSSNQSGFRKRSPDQLPRTASTSPEPGVVDGSSKSNPLVPAARR